MHDSEFRPALEPSSLSLEAHNARLHRLYEATAQIDMPFRQQAEQVLRVVTDTLHATHAVVGRVTEDRYEIESCYAPNISLDPGDHVELRDTYEGWHRQTSAVLAISNLNTSAFSSHRCFSAYTPLAYIGIAIRVDAWRTFTLGIYNETPHTPLYTEDDAAYIQLVGQWFAAALRKQRHEQERELLIDELSAFSHTVAHDLKAPLSTILGYAHILTTDASTLPDADVSEFGAIILEKGIEMRSLMDALLLLAQVRSSDAARDIVEMGGLVDSALKRLEEPIQLQQADITQPDTWPTALGHGPWIETVWVNYISNAIKYGDTPPVIMLGTDTLPNGMTRFWVQDNGCGLTRDQQDRLFTPFTRFSGTAEGHGLGLSIVKRIIERLGGDVGVESDGPGQGSVFFFTLPAT